MNNFLEPETAEKHIPCHSAMEKTLGRENSEHCSSGRELVAGIS